MISFEVTSRRNLQSSTSSVISKIKKQLQINTTKIILKEFNQKIDMNKLRRGSSNSVKSYLLIR
jgi:hypothetical protein